MTETKPKKSVHFASQDTTHTIQNSSNKGKSRFIVIEDETQNPSRLEIPEKSMKVLSDCSKMRMDKQLTKLAKDGVIFLRAPNTNGNEQRNNAMKLRNTMIKLLSKYQFVETVNHPKHDASKSLEENDWIPEHAIKPNQSSLKAIFVGSIGKNEPKWRSFWQWNDWDTNMKDGDDNSNNKESIAPESQSSLYSPSTTPHSCTNDEVGDLTFEQLNDKDKRTIYEWAIEREQTIFFKKRALKLFADYGDNECGLEWKAEVVDPLWFRIQSSGSILHCDIPYILNHTDLLKKSSAQRLLISGIDMMNKERFIGKKAKILKQKLAKPTEKCSLCSYVYTEKDDDDDDVYNGILCENCCDSRFGVYTVWTALDYFESPFCSGSMVFALGSHSKYKGIHKATMNGETVPNEYKHKTMAEKQNNIKWGFVDELKPGDQFVFNIKTLHASTQSKDGFLRARMDLRIANRVSDDRLRKEMKEMNKNANHLGLSQLCSQSINNNKTQTITQINQTQNENETENDNLSPELCSQSKQSSLNDNNDDDIDIDINNMKPSDEMEAKKQSEHHTLTQDLPTQMEMSQDEEVNDNQDIALKCKKKTLSSLTPQDESHETIPQNTEENMMETVPETPPKQIRKPSLSTTSTTSVTPQSARSVKTTATKENQESAKCINNVMNNEKNKMREIVPSTTQNESSFKVNKIPQLEEQDSGSNCRKRVFADMDDELEEREKDNIISNYKKQKVSRELTQSNLENVSNISFLMNSNDIKVKKMRMNTIHHLNTMSDDELCRGVSLMRNRLNNSFKNMKSEMNQACNLMEVAHERYVYTKQQYEQERERANHYQTKNQDLQKKLIENHNMLFQMFDQ